MITILHISDGYQHFDTAIRTYISRLERRIILKTIKPTRHTNPEYIRRVETEKIAEYLRSQKGGVIWLCDERGGALSTKDFASELTRLRDQGRESIFVIGGSYGFDLEILSPFSTRLIRLSDFVLPHSLAFLVLVEQIYRVHEIARGSSYHHE